MKTIQGRITVLVFFLLAIFAESALAQGRFKGQYHHGRYNRLISPGNIAKNELLTFYSGLGFTTYYGDLCEKIECMQLRPNFGGGALLRTNMYEGRIYLRSDINYFRLYSDDSYQNRNLNFRSGNVEWFVAGQMDLFPYTKHFRRRPLVTPYGFLGLGMAYFNPRGELDGNWYSLRPLQTEGKKYSSVTLVIPYGAGIKVKYTQNWSFGAEAGYRVTFTDRLDDVSSKQYQDVNSFSDPVAAALSRKATNPKSLTRGNPKRNDGYFIFQAKVMYTLTRQHHARFRGKQHILRKR